MTKRPQALTTYVTTAIPYVNAPPHIGFAMELVIADVYARYRRLRGDDVRFLTGTDDNSLKNVQAAEAEGVATAALVERNASAFRELRELLGLSFDDFIQTSTDPRHLRGVEALWRACDARGDIYKRPYRGLYCVGCEQFYAIEDLEDGFCPEHRSRPEVVAEDNYFFRLSRYEAAILEALESGQLTVAPAQYRNEILAFVRGGLQDFSISRSSQRARGWGIGVPGDDEQVMYVWFDALGNYITALNYGGDGPDYDRYWTQSTSRVHHIGKGITRFHAVYWPAMLLSAGLPLPSAIVVHGYLTVEGQKIGKSLGNAIDPKAVVAAEGVDAVRYFVCRHIRSGRDGDFSADRVAAARDSELADGWGNLLRRSVAMIDRYFAGQVPSGAPESSWVALAAEVRGDYERAFADFRHDDALVSAWRLVDAANRYAVEQAPWQLAKRRAEPRVEAKLRDSLYTLAEALRLIAVYLEPFMPAAVREARRQLGITRSLPWASATKWGQLRPGTAVPSGPTLFPKAG